MPPTGPVICKVCGEECASQAIYLRHRSGRHSEPIPVRLPDDSVETVQQADGGGYICWCKAPIQRRDTCIAHVVKQHLEGNTSIPIFKGSSGKARATAASANARSKSLRPADTAIDRTDAPTAAGHPLATSSLASGAGDDVPPAFPLPSFSSATPALTPAQARTSPPAPAASSSSQQVVDGDGQPELEQPELEPGKDYLVSHLSLDPVGVYVHSGLRILQCRHCRAYLATLDLNGHMVAHGLSIDRALIDKATLLCRELRLYESQTDVPFPTPLGPPIQHLSSVPGYLCRQAGCGYAVVNHEGMTKHEQKKHGLASLHRDLHTRSRFALQVLFPRRRTYTAVDLDLPASSKPDVIKYIIQEFLPVATAPPPITTATDDRGRAPLERAMQWDDLLLDIRQDRQALQNLVALRAKPTESDEGIFLRLAESVKAWCLHIHAAMKAHPARNDLERVIMYGKAPWPASGAKRWKPVSDTNNAYYAEYAQLLRCVVRQLRGHPFSLPLPLTTEQRTAFETLRGALEDASSSQADIIEAIQSASWQLVSVANEEPWGMFFQAYFALIALRLDGTYAPASVLTCHLAKYSYLIRAPCLLEALRKPPRESAGYLTSLHETVLNLSHSAAGMNYKWVQEAQNRVSGYALRETRPPGCWVSEDCQSYVSGTSTLTLTVLRGAMQELIRDIWTTYDELVGKRFVTCALKDVVDDLQNTTRGYSFLSEEPFASRQNACFYHVLERHSLCDIDGLGVFSWNQQAIDKFLSGCVRLWRLFGYGLSYTGQISVRRTQLHEAKFLNDDHLRSFVWQSAEVLMLLLYSKNSHSMDEDRFYPAFLHQLFAEILLELLGGGLRNAEAYLIHVKGGAAKAQVHRTYLFSEFGVRVPAERHYPIFQNFNIRYLGVNLGTRAARHVMIAIAREFIMACEAFTAVQRALAKSSDHSAAVEEAHYAIKYGDVRRLSSFTMWEARWIIQQWWGVLGLRGVPPRPIRDRQVFEEEDLSAKVSRVVESTVKAALAPAINGTLKDIVQETMLSMAPSIIAHLAQHHAQSLGHPAPSAPLSPLPLTATALPAQSVVPLPPSEYLLHAALPDVHPPNRPSNKRTSTAPLTHSPQSKRPRLANSPAGSVGPRLSPSCNDLDLSSPYLGSPYGPTSSQYFGSSYGPMSSPHFGSPSAAASPRSSPSLPGASSPASSFTGDFGDLFFHSPSQDVYPGAELPLLPPHPDAYNGEMMAYLYGTD